MEKITQIAEETAIAHNCVAKCELRLDYPPTVNHPVETKWVEEVANKYFGGVSTEDLPLTASEDFAYFLQKKPGCFFCLGTKRKEDETLHSDTYDFNDECLATGALFWVKLCEHRLEVDFS